MLFVVPLHAQVIQGHFEAYTCIAARQAFHYIRPTSLLAIFLVISSAGFHARAGIFFMHTIQHAPPPMICYCHCHFSSRGRRIDGHARYFC